MLETKSHRSASSSMFLREASRATMSPAQTVAAPHAIRMTACREFRIDATTNASPPALTVNVHKGHATSADMLTDANAGSKNVGENCWFAKPGYGLGPRPWATVAPRSSLKTKSMFGD